MSRQHSLAELATVLNGVSNVVVASHYSPDVDAYGSQCGLALSLESIGKSVALVNETGILEKYRFVAGVDRVTTTFPAGDWDLLVLCDCGDRKRIGDSLVDQMTRFKATLNLDHHISNDLFATWNHVDAQASSTSELVVRLLREMRIPISAPVAACLLAGIIGDTGSFRYSSTTADTLRSAADLVDAGADPSALSNALFGNMQRNAVELHAEVILGLSFSSRGGVAFGAATPELMSKHACEVTDVEGLVERIRDINGVQIAALAYWDGEIWRISLRSKRRDLDVSVVAQKFGGGGHRAAAAFRWRFSFETLREQLLPALDNLISG